MSLYKQEYERITHWPEISAQDLHILHQHVPAKLFEYDIWIIEFIDLQCPFCRDHFRNNTLETVKQKYDNVGYTRLSFPLSFHSQANNAALMGMCILKYD